MSYYDYVDDNLTDKPPTNYSSTCEIELDPKRCKNTYVLEFSELVTVTKDHSIKEGALLVFFLYTVDGEMFSTWLPKKLCSNLDLENNRVLIWNKFVDGNKKEILPYCTPYEEYEFDE